MRVIAHGGAGGVPDDPEPRQETLEDAAAAGTEADTPIDAVETAIRALETDEAFNAGVGSALQADGYARTEAGVMTADRSVGAVCSMPGVEHAVSVARVVMEETPHVLVSGVHAVDLADEFGIETGVDLVTEDRRTQYEGADPPTGCPREQLAWLETRFGEGADQAGGDGENRTGGDGVGAGRSASREFPDHDTVGAVAFDGGTFAAATSTGGRSFALAGRVGDVPQVGSGFYCSPAGGASATGAGEDIARVTLSRRAVDHLENGLDAQEAADRAIAEFEEITGAGAGVIVLDEEQAGSAFNTDGMQTSVVDRV